MGLATGPLLPLPTRKNSPGGQGLCHSLYPGPPAGGAPQISGEGEGCWRVAHPGSCPPHRQTSTQTKASVVWSTVRNKNFTELCLRGRGWAGTGPLPFFVVLGNMQKSETPSMGQNAPSPGAGKQWPQ